MAKVGEGDARWIVQDRADGANVNQWHWTEKDVLTWTKSRLGELLNGMQLFSDANGSASITKVQTVTGDAVINVRKGKLIATYELNVEVGFEGRASTNGSDLVTGRLQLPYVSEENHDEDPELSVLTPSEGPKAAIVKQGILANRKVVYDKIHQFVRELRAGGPHSPAAAGTAPSQAAGSSSGPQAATGTPAPPPMAPKPSTKAPQIKAGKRDDGGATQSLELEERFYARPADIYEALTDERRMRAFSQSEAQSDARPGGAFRLYGGSVTGTYKQLDAPTTIVQDWRFSSWPDGATSQVAITLEEPDTGNTIVKLRQTGIPREDRFGNEGVLSTTEAGWKGQIFSRIRMVFGYGV